MSMSFCCLGPKEKNGCEKDEEELLFPLAAADSWWSTTRSKIIIIFSLSAAIALAIQNIFVGGHFPHFCQNEIFTKVLGILLIMEGILILFFAATLIFFVRICANSSCKVTVTTYSRIGESVSNEHVKSLGIFLLVAIVALGTALSIIILVNIQMASCHDNDIRKLPYFFTILVVNCIFFSPLGWAFLVTIVVIPGFAVGIIILPFWLAYLCGKKIYFYSLSRIPK